MEKITKHWFLIGLLVLPACKAVQKNRSEKQFAREVRVLEKINTDSLQSGRYTVRMEMAGEQQQLWAEIIPDGVFSFRPGAGFTGEAARVTVFGHRQAGSLRTDSSASFEHRHVSAVDRDTSAGVYISSLQQEERRSLPGRWLVWVTVAGLLALFLFLRRVFR